MDIIYQSKIKDEILGVEKDLKIIRGLNPQFNLDIQQEWNRKNIEIVELIKQESQGNLEKIKELLDKCMFEDSHWNWVGKAFNCNGTEYEWFYLIVDDLVQASCVIYHPKKSKVDSTDIFYIKYLAVAPWNRNTPFSKRQFGALGSILLGNCTIYSNKNFLYRFGFSLHSLPQALDYYVNKIKMNDYGKDPNEENLHYLEINEDNSKILVSEYVC